MFDGFGAVCRLGDVTGLQQRLYEDVYGPEDVMEESLFFRDVTAVESAPIC